MAIFVGPSTVTSLRLVKSISRNWVDLLGIRIDLSLKLCCCGNGGSVSLPSRMDLIWTLEPANPALQEPANPALQKHGVSRKLAGTKIENMPMA